MIVIFNILQFLEFPEFGRSLMSGAGVGFVTLTPSPGTVVVLLPTVGVVELFVLTVVAKVVAARVVGGAEVGLVELSVLFAGVCVDGGGVCVDGGGGVGVNEGNGVGVGVGVGGTVEIEVV